MLDSWYLKDLDLGRNTVPSTKDESFVFWDVVLEILPLRKKVSI